MSRTAKRTLGARRAAQRRRDRRDDDRARSTDRRAATIRPRGTASPAISLIGWAAALVLAVGVAGGVVGVASIPLGGNAPGNAVAVAGIGVFSAGAFVSFGLAILWSAIPQLWADPSRDWIRSVTRTGLGWRVAGTIPFAALATAVFLLGLAPMSEFSPAVDDLYTDVLGPAIIALLLGSVVIAAVVGAMVMTGRRGAVVGLLFGCGFIAAGVGAYFDAGPWIVAGMIVLCVSVAGFFLIGALSGYLPSAFLVRYSGSAGLLLGVGTTVTGVIVLLNTSRWGPLLLGGLSLAAWAGIALSSRKTRSPEAESAVARRP